MKFDFKLILEIIPTLIFLVFYHLYDLQTAIFFFIFASIINFLLIYLKDKKLSMLLLFSTVILTIFGGFSLLFEDTIFFKIKPTITFLLLGMFLIYDLSLRKEILFRFLQKFLDLNGTGYKFIQRSVIVYCFAFAVLNEVLWRNFSEETWVYFKLFGVPTLNIVFTLALMAFAINRKDYQKIKY